MEVRTPRPDEIPKLMEFLDRNLRPGANWSIQKEYPNVFAEGNRTNLRIIEGENQILAHTAIKYHLIKSVVGIFKVAAIGSVVTSPDHRNQGLSQAILKDALDSAKREGADFAILWTDLFDFYRKMDFELAGHEISLIMDEPLNVPINPHHKILKSTRVAPESIARLYSQHTVGTVRSAEDVRKFLEIPNTDLYTLWNAAGELKAYAVEGKGADLDSYVHEWGGGVSELLELFAHVRRDQNRPIVVISPANAQNLITQMRAHNVAYNEGFLGMIRILEFDNLFQKIHRYARSLGIQDFVLEKNGDQFVVGRDQRLLKLDDVKDLTRLLFGPYDFSENVSILNPVLPIPMWIWGWDSV